MFQIFEEVVRMIWNLEFVPIFNTNYCPGRQEIPWEPNFKLLLFKLDQSSNYLLFKIRWKYKNILEIYIKTFCFETTFCGIGLSILLYRIYFMTVSNVDHLSMLLQNLLCSFLSFIGNLHPPEADCSIFNLSSVVGDLWDICSEKTWPNHLKDDNKNKYRDKDNDKYIKRTPTNDDPREVVKLWTFLTMRKI